MVLMMKQTKSKGPAYSYNYSLQQTEQVILKFNQLTETELEEDTF